MEHATQKKNGDAASTALVAPSPSRAGALAPLEFTEAQRLIIRDTFAKGSSEEEFVALMEIARIRGLNPLLRQNPLRQALGVGARRPARARGVWATQVSIDGLRLIAERTGRYDGQDEAEFETDKSGKLIAARVKIYRKDWSRPMIGVAYWSERVQKKKDGSVTAFWDRMPRTMLAKCAEADGFRRGFPEETSGLHIPEETASQDLGPVDPEDERAAIREDLAAARSHAEIERLIPQLRALPEGPAKEEGRRLYREAVERVDAELEAAKADGKDPF